VCVRDGAHHTAHGDVNHRSYVIGKVQAKADGVQDDSLVSRHKLTPPRCRFRGAKTIGSGDEGRIGRDGDTHHDHQKSISIFTVYTE